MAKNILDFEKPIIELENKIEEMRKYEGHLDISGEIKTLEEKVNQLKTPHNKGKVLIAMSAK